MHLEVDFDSIHLCRASRSRCGSHFRSSSVKSLGKKKPADACAFAGFDNPFRLSGHSATDKKFVRIVPEESKFGGNAALPAVPLLSRLAPPFLSQVAPGCAAHLPELRLLTACCGGCCNLPRGESRPRRSNLGTRSSAGFRQCFGTRLAHEIDVAGHLLVALPARLGASHGLEIGQK